MITVEHISKDFRTKDGATAALTDVSFVVEKGSFFTLLGPSGCGKTTTMRSIAGLERPDLGRIDINGRTVFDGAAGTFLRTSKRPIGMVFQSYAIWPHMTVFDNVAYPLRAHRVSRPEIKRQVEEALEMVGLAGIGSRRAPQLSGGQQQRVALARAIVARPEILILDEPLSNLDSAMRVQMRSELKRLQSALGLTTVYVTHDQHEALAMSDDLAVMRLGRLVQVGAPWDIYHRPIDRFVAEFVGATNILTAQADVALTAGDNMVVTKLGPLRAMAATGDSASRLGVRALVSIRPEVVSVHEAGSDEAGPVGKVVESSFVGEHIEYILDVNGYRLRARRPSVDGFIPSGRSVAVDIRPEGCVLIPHEPPVGGLEATDATQDDRSASGQLLAPTSER